MLRTLRREHGQDLVEYALVLPILLLLLLGIAQFGLVVFSYNTIGDAAREAARYGVIGTHADDTAAIKNVALAVTNAAGLNPDPAYLTITPRHIGDTIQVVVTYKVVLIAWIAGKIGSPSIKMQAESTKLIELE